MSSPALDRDLTVADAAEIKQVSTRTIRRWIADGILPAYRVGPSLVRIKPDDLDAIGRRIPSAAFRQAV